MGNRPLPHEVRRVFDPLDRFFADLCTGEIDTTPDGEPLFFDQGTAFPVAPALRGWVETWDRITRKLCLKLDTQPLLRLCQAIERDSTITEPDALAAKAVIDRCRQIYTKSDIYQIKELVRTAQLAMQFEAAGLLDNAKEAA